MTRVRVEVPQVLKLIEAAVKERGEGWVYPDTGQCRYLYDPEEYLNDDGYDDGLTTEEAAMVAYFGEDEVKPACLVGLVLHTLDPRFDGPMMVQNENSIEGWMTDETHEEEFGSLTYEFPRESIVVLQAAQSAQDSGKPWGEAFQRAVGAAERMGFH